MIIGGLLLGLAGWGAKEINAGHWLATNAPKVPQLISQQTQSWQPTTIANLVDKRAKTQSAPTNYAASPDYYALHTFEMQPNTFKTTSGNQALTFQTLAFLPVTWQHSGDAGNLQALSLTDGRYAYVLQKTSTNYGRLVRYDLPALNYYRRVLGWRAYRYASYMAMQNRATPLQQTMLSTTIKRGPIFHTGHGQALTYDAASQQFYLWRDDQVKTAAGQWTFPENEHNRIVQINRQSLAPVRSYPTQVTANGYPMPSGHVLTTDGHNHWYFYTYGSRQTNVKIYQGRRSNGKFTWKLVQTIAQQPGTHVQSMAYQAATGRLYLVSDDALVSSFPAKRLGHLKAADMHYSYFQTHREFEGVAFVDQRTFLLTIRGPEILESQS